MPALEKDFNTRAGFDNAACRLPDFLKFEKPPLRNVAFDTPDSEPDKALVF